MDKLEVPFTCPDCRHVSKITPEVEARGKLRCRCGAEIQITGDGLRQTQKVLDGIERSLNNLFK